MRLIKLWGWHKPIESLEFVVKLNKLFCTWISFKKFSALQDIYGKLQIFSIFKEKESRTELIYSHMLFVLVNYFCDS